MNGARDDTLLFIPLRLIQLWSRLIKTSANEPHDDDEVA